MPGLKAQGQQLSKGRPSSR